MCAKDSNNGVRIRKEDVPPSAKTVAVSGLTAALAAKRVSSESGGASATVFIQPPKWQEPKCDLKELRKIIPNSAAAYSINMDVKGVRFELEKCLEAKKVGATILLFLSNAAKVLDILPPCSSGDKLILCLKQTGVDGVCNAVTYEQWKNLLQEEQFNVPSPNSL